MDGPTFAVPKPKIQSKNNQYKQRAYYYKRGHSLFGPCKNFRVSAELRPLKFPGSVTES
jgi:hypothetical protein